MVTWFLVGMQIGVTFAWLLDIQQNALTVRGWKAVLLAACVLTSLWNIITICEQIFEPFGRGQDMTPTLIGFIGSWIAFAVTSQFFPKR